MKRPIGPKTEHQIVSRERGARDDDVDRSHGLELQLGELFEMHRPKVRRLCLDMMKDPALADEMVQETLTQAWAKLPEFDHRVRFQYWIYGIARNLCRNARRKRGELLTEDGVLETSDPVTSVLASLRAEERTRVLQDAAAAVLDEMEQDAVYMRYVEGMSQDQITEVLGLTGSGARGLLQRCRRKLKKGLWAQLESLGHGKSLFDKSMDL